MLCSHICKYFIHHIYTISSKLWPSVTFTPSPLKALAICHIYTISSGHPSHLHHLLWKLGGSVTFTPSPLKALAIRHIYTISSESSGHPSHLHHLLWKLGVKLNQTWQECSLDCPLMCIGNVCFLNQFMNLQMVIIIRGPSWSWSYGNWIYNYAINAYHHSWLGVLDTTLCDKLSVTYSRSVVFSRFSHQ